MNVVTALETIVKPKLDDSFGRGIAMLIILNASRMANITLVEMDTNDYCQLVENICTDHRVVKMWGEAGCRKQLDSWLSLIES